MGFARGGSKFVERFVERFEDPNGGLCIPSEIFGIVFVRFLFAFGDPLFSQAFVNRQKADLVP